MSTCVRRSPRGGRILYRTHAHKSLRIRLPRTSDTLVSHAFTLHSSPFLLQTSNFPPASCALPVERMVGAGRLFRRPSVVDLRLPSAMRHNAACGKPRPESFFAFLGLAC